MPKKVTPRGKAATTPKVTPAKKSTTKKKKSPAKRGPTQRYVRNLHGAAGGVRILLDNENKIALKPRGEVGDLAPVTKEDRSDPKYVANYGVLFEEISSAEAQKVIEKQSTNAQAPRQRTIDLIRDEYGDPVKGEVKMEESFEAQGQVVAHIQDGPDGRFTEGHQGLITRADAQAPEQVEVPGSAPVQKSGDQLARGKTQGDADALRDNLRVSVDPVQKAE